MPYSNDCEVTTSSESTGSVENQVVHQTDVEKHFVQSELLGFLNDICSDGEVREIRFLNGTGSSSKIKLKGARLVPNQLNEIHHFISQGYSCFITINPLHESTERYANDDDVLRRSNILIDIDVEKNNGEDNASKIDGAKSYCSNVIKNLTTAIPSIQVRSVAVSGNGVHLLITADLANDTAANEAVKRFLKNLAMLVPSHAFIIDSNVANASRLTRLIGAPNFKSKDARPTYRFKNPKTEGKPITIKDLEEFNSKFTDQAPRNKIHLPAPPSSGRNDPSTVFRARRYLAKCPPSIQGQNGSDALFEAACRLIKGFLLDSETALVLLIEYNQLCLPPWPERELRRKLDEAAKSKFPDGYLLNAPGFQQPVSTVHIHGSQKNTVGTELVPVQNPEPIHPKIDLIIDGCIDLHNTISVLRPVLERLPTVFQFGQKLVRVDIGSGGSFATGSQYVEDDWATIKDVNVSWLSANIPKHVNFLKEGPRHTRHKTSAPDRIYQALIDDVDWNSIRPLKGVSYTPIIRPDGTFWDQQGYDERTGFWNCSHIRLNISGTVTQEDAKRSADNVMRLVSDFPFANEDYAAVWLCLCLTILARPAIDGTVPMFPITANTRGTGKTKLAELASMIATGKTPALTPWPDSGSTTANRALDSEIQKILLATAIEGSRTLVFDNIRSGGGLGSPSLDCAVTAGTFGGRILSKSENRSVPWQTIVIGTGNNINLVSDAGRRTWPIYLETPLEQPENRADFEIDDLMKHVKENWAGYLKDLFIILVGHAQAGRPGPTDSPPRDFVQWHHIIRNAVWWATGNDANGVFKDHHVADTELESERQLVRGLFEAQQMMGNQPFSANGLHTLMCESKPGTFPRLEEEFRELNGSLTGILGISKKISKLKNAVRDGLLIKSSKNRTSKVAEYFITEQSGS